jgi:NAD(P)-dependent dehydrogenase (short-subunit alcohol dehydrogenase family)
VIAARAAATGRTEEQIEADLGSNSVRRLIDADEVAWVVTFLASPRASSITGDAIACGGGQPGVIHY